MLTDNFEDAKITVEKTKLLEALRANRTRHVAEAAEAEKGFRRALEAELRKMLADVLEGRAARTSTDLKAPVSHERDYDVAIDMLEWSTATSIVVSSSQFRMYVRDEWDWKSTFKMSTERYAGRV